jgi:OmpA-OmpF porin, OOP family
MKKIFTTAAILLIGICMHAQFVYDYLKAADTYFQKGDYASAAEYYLKYLGRDSVKSKKEFIPYTVQNPQHKKAPALTNQERAIYNLGESYRLLNYPSKAEPYYQEAMTIKGKFPLAQYHLGTVQRSLEKYTEAERDFKGFLDTYKTNDTYTQNAQRELKNLEFIQAQLKKKDLKYYTVKKAPAELNTTGASYAPAWLNASTLLFTSTRPFDTTSKAKKVYVNRVYQAAYSEGVLAGINKTNLPQDKELQQGVVSVTPDGNTLFLTRWSINGKVKSSSLYTSTRNGDSWSEPVKLDAAINAAGANTQQPFVTPDGKHLLFASDRSGGIGGFDIWYAPLADGKPGTPANLGAVINTSFDEQAPSYHEASQSLIFSSNGRVGMGGYDFFQSKGTVSGSFAEPVNFGYPVNSVKDDIYFTSRGPAKNILEEVMLSSDREAACCLELFFLKKIRPLKQISGRVVSCDPTKPLTGATVSVIDTINNKTVFTKTLGADGSYAFTLEDHQPLKVKAEATGYITNAIHVGTPADIEEETMGYPDLCLLPEPPKVNETFVVENVYYGYDSAALKPESYPALDEIVRMMNTYPNMVIELSAHTDSKGTDAYNQKLSDARAKSVVDYLISKGITAERMIAKGYGETQPIEPNEVNGKDNPAGREKNRRTEFKVLKNE